MKRISVLISILLMCMAPMVWAQSYTPVDYPGALATELYGGPNPQGIAVGNYEDGSGVFHAFTYNYHNGTYTSFDPPNSIYSSANWISPQGDIVGWYEDQSYNVHGFVLSHGKYTNVDYPGAAQTLLDGISPSGDLAGVYCVGACDTEHGFTFSKKGAFTSFDPPGAVASDAGPINPAGAIVGFYWTALPLSNNGLHGYLLYKGTYTAIDFPGAGNYGTYAGANNPQGDIVGGYIDASNVGHAFLLRNGTFTSFDYPGGVYCGASGISPTGVIVGVYYDSQGNPHGFVRTP